MIYSLTHDINFLMDILLVLVVSNLIAMIIFMLIILKLVQLIRDLANINQLEDSSDNIIVREADGTTRSYSEYKESELGGNPPENTDTVPLDRFTPRTDKPLTVKYSDDKEGNRMMEVEDAEE